MSASVVAACEPLAVELHATLAALDPARLRADALPALRARLEHLRAPLDRLLKATADLTQGGPLWSALHGVRTHLDTLPDPGLPARAARRAWIRLRTALLRAYAAWSAALAAWDVHVPALRPTNYARNLLHVASGTTAAIVLALFPWRTLLLAIITPVLVWAWTVEFLRRRNPGLNARVMAVFAPVAHPHEWHRVNSATWYASALFLLAWADIPTASMVALVSLAWGDPAAAIVGRRFGRTRFANGRSVEGTAAFIAAASVASFVALRLGFPGVDLPLAVGMAAAGAVAGAVAELVSRRVDDNFSIPVSAAVAAAMVGLAFG